MSGYGKVYEGDGISSGTTFKPGINSGVIMKSFGLVSNDKGTKLVVEWEDEEGSVVNRWQFPKVDNQKSREYYDKYRKDKFDTFELYLEDEQKKQHYWVKHVVCAYTSHEKFEEAIGKLPENATFEEFINTAASLLPQNYQQYKGKLKVGYTKSDGAYLAVPEAMWVAGRFWKLDQDAREDRDIDEKETKYFKYTPFPDREEQRSNQERSGAAPAQDQGEMKW